MVNFLGNLCVATGWVLQLPDASSRVFQIET
jgi:hypothetical protein